MARTHWALVALYYGFLILAVALSNPYGAAIAVAWIALANIRDIAADHAEAVTPKTIRAGFSEAALDASLAAFRSKHGPR